MAFGTILSCIMIVAFATVVAWGIGIIIEWMFEDKPDKEVKDNGTHPNV